MSFNTSIEKSESSLEMIQSKLENVTRDVFISGLSARVWTESQIKEKTAEVKHAILVVERETDSIKEYIKDYFCQYAVVNKNRLTFTESLCNRMKCTLSQIKYEFKNSCPRYKNRGLCVDREKTIKSVFEASRLSIPYFVDEIFPFEEQGYKQCVIDLLDATMVFNYNAIILLRFCRDSINNENRIKSNPEIVYSIYEECTEKEKQKIRNSRYYTEILKSNAKFQPDTLTLRIRQSINRNIGIASCYHEVNTPDFHDHCEYTAIQEDRANNFFDIEQKLWKTRTEHEINEIRFLIENLDTIYDRFEKTRRKRTKIPALILALVMNYCKPFDEGDEKMFVSKYMIPIHSAKTRKYRLTDYKAINGEKDNISSYEKDFNTMVSKLISEHFKTENYNKLTS